MMHWNQRVQSPMKLIYFSSYPALVLDDSILVVLQQERQSI